MPRRDVLDRTINVGGGGRTTEQIADELVDHSKALPDTISVTDVSTEYVVVQDLVTRTFSDAWTRRTKRSPQSDVAQSHKPCEPPKLSTVSKLNT